MRLPAVSRPANPEATTRPLNIGHRGASGEAPENTLAAFELALRQGADGIEFDVHLSADGIPVVIHDSRLNRTTSGRGRVRSHSLAELRHLDAGSWFNRRYPPLARARYAGGEIPLLAEVLAWVRDRKCLAYLEIKRARPRYIGIEERVLEEIYRARVSSLVTVISFSFPALKRLRLLDPEIALGIDSTRPLLAVPRAKVIGASCVLPHWAFAPRRFLSRAHGAGLAVIVWGLDERHWMHRKVTDGVDGIITRYPARLAALLNRGQTTDQSIRSATM